jgi:Binding-protein-dependent transport system inner membrane component
MEHTSVVERIARAPWSSWSSYSSCFRSSGSSSCPSKPTRRFCAFRQPLLHSDDARQLLGADHRQAGHGGGNARHRVHEKPVEQRAAVDVGGRDRAPARRAGGLCVRTFQVPAWRRHRLHLALLSLRASALGLASLVALISGDRATAHPVDRVRLFRGHLARHEYAYRVAGHSWWRTFTRIAIPLAGPAIAAAGLLAFIFCWNSFVFALILASAQKQPVTVGALAVVTASGIQYGQIAAAIVLSVAPTLALAAYAQRYLVEDLSLGALKG